MKTSIQQHKIASLLFFLCFLLGNSVSLKSQETMFFAGGNALGSVPTATPNAPNNALLSNAGNPQGLVVHQSSNTLYWINSATNTIERATISGNTTTNRQNVATIASGAYALALAGDVLFWTNPQAGTIGKVNRDGSGLNASLVTGLNSPHGIAATTGEIFWSEAGSPSRIMKAQADGLFASVVVPNAGTQVRNLALSDGVLYWASATSFQRAFMNGSNSSSIAHNISSPDDIGGITVAGGNIYLARPQSGSIGRISILLTNYQAAFVSGLTSPRQLFIATVQSTAVQILGAEPAQAGPGIIVRIAGINFANITEVRFGTTPAQQFQVVSSSEILARVGNTGGNGITIISGGQPITFSAFQFVQAPTIANFSPQRGKEGDIITITGTNFIEPVTVRFGNIAATTVQRISATEVRATVGPGANGEVRVSTPGGAATTQGFTFEGAALEVVRFRSQSLPLASLNDFYTANSLVELTLKNNAAATVRFRLVGTISQNGLPVLESVNNLAPLQQLEPGNIFAFTASDVFREGALSSPGATSLQFPSGNYTVCIRVVAENDPTRNVLPPICEEIFVAPRLSPASVKTLVTSIMGFPVTLTDVEADMDKYYLTGRMKFRNNDFFSTSDEREAIFLRVPISVAEVPFNAVGNVDVVPVGGRVTLEDKELEFLLHNWIPVKLVKPEGIVITRKSSGSRVGMIRDFPQILLNPLLSRAAKSGVTQEYQLQLKAGEEIALQGNTAVPLFYGDNSDNPIALGFNVTSIKEGVWTARDLKLSGVSNIIVAEQSVIANGNFKGQSVVMTMTPDSVSIVIAPPVIELNSFMLLKLSGDPLNDPQGFRYTRGDLEIEVKGRSQPFKFTVRSATITETGELVNADIFLPNGQELDFRSFFFKSDGKALLLKKRGTIYDVELKGVSQLRWKDLVSWDLESKVTFEGARSMQVDMSGVLPTFNFVVLKINFTKMRYAASSGRVFLDGNATFNIPTVEASGGNFIFEPNGIFYPSDLAFKKKFFSRYEISGMVKYNAETNVWQGAVQKKIEKWGKSLTIDGEFRYAPDDWYIKLRAKRDPGFPLNPPIVYLSEITGEVQYQAPRWKVDIAAIIDVQYRRIAGARIRLDVAGSLEWGGEEDAFFKFEGKGDLITPVQSVELGTLKLTANLSTGKVEGSFVSKFTYLSLADVDLMGNLLIDGEKFVLDVQGRVNVYNLVNAIGRFVIAKDYKTQFRVKEEYGQNDKGEKVWFTYTQNVDGWSGFYIDVEDVKIDESESIDLWIVSGSISAKVVIRKWILCPLDKFDLQGGLVARGDVKATAKGLTIFGYSLVSFSASAKARGSFNVRADDKDFAVDGSILVQLSGKGSAGKSCSVGCNDTSKCVLGASARFCAESSLKIRYSRKDGFYFENPLSKISL